MRVYIYVHIHTYLANHTEYILISICTHYCLNRFLFFLPQQSHLLSFCLRIHISVYLIFLCSHHLLNFFASAPKPCNHTWYIFRAIWGYRIMKQVNVCVWAIPRRKKSETHRSAFLCFDLTASTDSTGSLTHYRVLTVKDINSPRTTFLLSIFSEVFLLLERVSTHQLL